MSDPVHVVTLVEYQSEMALSQALMRSILQSAAASAIEKLDLNNIPFKLGKDARFLSRTEVVLIVKEPS